MVHSSLVVQVWSVVRRSCVGSLSLRVLVFRMYNTWGLVVLLVVVVRRVARCVVLVSMASRGVRSLSSSRSSFQDWVLWVPGYVV